METPPSTTPADLTQLIRYVLTIDHLPDAEAAGRARGVLTSLGLIVDRLDPGTPGEAEVAALNSDSPGTEAIQQALEEAGFQLVNVTREVG